MIYFIRRPGDGRIKIGTTARLSDRVKYLGYGLGEELEVLAVVDGRHKEEKGLHRRFANLRVEGEWFEPGDDLLGFIANEGRPWDGQDEATTKLIPVAMVLRGTEEWRDWLKDEAKRYDISMCELIDWVLKEYAEHCGLEPPPPRLAPEPPPARKGGGEA